MNPFFSYKKEGLKLYNIRKFTADDIFPMCSLLSKIGIEDVKSVISPDVFNKIRKIDTDKSLDAETKLTQKNSISYGVVLSILNLILKNISLVKTDLYEFMGSVCGVSAEEIQNLSMAEFTKTLFEITKSEDFKDFFKAVAELFS